MERPEGDAGLPGTEGHSHTPADEVPPELVRDRERLLADERSACRRAEAILETAFDAIVMIDGQGSICEFNPSAERMFGRARADVMGRDFAELLIPARFRGMHRRRLARLAETGDANVPDAVADLTAVRADGTEFPIEAVLTRILDSDPPLFGGHIRDMTAIRQNERRRSVRAAVTSVLADAHSIHGATSAILRSVCETLGWQVGELWLVDPDADVLRLFDAVSVPAGSSPGFVEVGRTWTFARGGGLPGTVWADGEPVWLSDLAAANHVTRVEPAIEAGLRATLAVPVRLGGTVIGALQFFAGSIESPDRPLLDLLLTAGDQIGQFIGRIRAEEERSDLLRRERAARADAEAALRIRDQLVTGLSHDLRNPLTVISGQVQVLQFLAGRDGEGLPRARLLSSLGIIGETTRRMTTLIDELMDVVHLQAGLHIELRRRPTDLARLTQRVVERHQQATATHDLRFEGTQPGPVGVWDPERLERVLVNIISNAIKFSPDGGDILVSVSRDGGWGVVTVSDHGVGIPSVDLPHVFERYHRARNVSQRFAGNGLGLAGARDLVDLHGGSIAITSVEGAGSTVIVRLPLHRPRHTPRSGHAATPSPTDPA